jgi:hypothetical protein
MSPVHDDVDVGGPFLVLADAPAFGAHRAVVAVLRLFALGLAVVVVKHFPDQFAVLRGILMHSPTFGAVLVPVCDVPHAAAFNDVIAVRSERMPVFCHG